MRQVSTKNPILMSFLHKLQHLIIESNKARVHPVPPTFTTILYTHLFLFVLLSQNQTEKNQI